MINCKKKNQKNCIFHWKTHYHVVTVQNLSHSIAKCRFILDIVIFLYFSYNCHLWCRAGMSDIFLKKDNPKTIQLRLFQFVPIVFGREDRHKKLTMPDYVIWQMSHDETNSYGLLKGGITWQLNTKTKNWHQNLNFFLWQYSSLSYLINIHIALYLYLTI